MSDLAREIVRIHNEYLNARNYSRLVDKVELEKLKDVEQSELLEILKSRDKDKLKDWQTRMEKKELEEMSVKDLRELASKLKVYGYGTMDKNTLVNEIRRIRNGQA